MRSKSVDMINLITTTNYETIKEDSLEEKQAPTKTITSDTNSLPYQSNGKQKSDVTSDFASNLNPNKPTSLEAVHIGAFTTKMRYKENKMTIIAPPFKNKKDPPK